MGSFPDCFCISLVFFFLLQKRKLGPGAYDVSHGGFSQKSVEERSDGPGWSRAYEVEKLAALPHLLNKEQWEMKRILVCKNFFLYNLILNLTLSLKLTGLKITTI